MFSTALAHSVKRQPSASKQDGASDFRFAWDLPLDLANTDPEEEFEGETRFVLGTLPLAGAWQVYVGHDTDGDAYLQLDHGKLPTGALGARVASEGAFVPETHRRYRLSAHLWQEDVQPSREARSLCIRVPDELDSPTPDLVRLFFPSVGEHGAELWTTVAFLSASSPYLEDLLASDSAESIPVGSKRPRIEQLAQPEPVSARATKDFDDSDDETDEAAWPGMEDPRERYTRSDCGDLSKRQITVTHAAQSTYRAVLRYLQTGFIRFAPLSSTCLPLDPAAPTTRFERIFELEAADEPGLPTFVSPKSTYRLAHLLRLDALQHLCLHAFRTSLSPHAAAHELFDPAAALFDAWRAVVLLYVVENWDEVTKTASWREVDARIERDEVPGAAPILRELMKAREARAAGAAAEKS
ncbi:hypothetical protein JCM10450v2_004863 [Rhodotorula kratochvilovae]